MTFAVDGGIEWERDTTNNVLTIRPANSPESGYKKGQMKEYDSVPYSTPWGFILGPPTTLVLEYGISNIGKWAFGTCKGLVNALTIPDSVTEIGEAAFVATSFDKVTLSNNLTKIGLQALSYCTSLVSVTIPKSVTEIDDYAFFESTGIQFIEFKHENAPIPSFGTMCFQLGTSEKPAKCSCISVGNWALAKIPKVTDSNTTWSYALSTKHRPTFKKGNVWKKESCIYMKKNGLWKVGIPYIKSGGQWK